MLTSHLTHLPFQTFSSSVLLYNKTCKWENNPLPVKDHKPHLSVWKMGRFSARIHVGVYKWRRGHSVGVVPAKGPWESMCLKKYCWDVLWWPFTIILPAGLLSPNWIYNSFSNYSLSVCDVKGEKWVVEQVVTYYFITRLLLWNFIRSTAFVKMRKWI